MCEKGASRGYPLPTPAYVFHMGRVDADVFALCAGMAGDAAIPPRISCRAHTLQEMLYFPMQINSTMGQKGVKDHGIIEGFL